MPTMLRHQCAAEVEAEPRSADAPGLRILCAHEAPKHLCVLLPGYPDAPILHTDVHHPGCGLLPDGDENRTSPGTVLDRVANQVRHHLFYPSRVDVCHKYGMRRVNRYLVLCRRLLQARSYSLHERHHVGWAALAAQPPSLYVGHIQQLLCERTQIIDRLVDLL